MARTKLWELEVTKKFVSTHSENEAGLAQAPYCWSQMSQTGLQDLVLSLTVQCAWQLDGQQTASMCCKPSELGITTVKLPHGLMRNDYALQHTNREPVACHLVKPEVWESAWTQEHYSVAGIS